MLVLPRPQPRQALSCSPNLIGICAPAAPPIMLRIGTHSLNPIPNPNPKPNPTQEHTVTLGLQLSVLQPRTTPTALIFDWISFILVYSGIIIIIMDIFVIGLCILSLLCALIYKRSTHPECRDVQFSKFKKTYLFVYLLATGRTSSRHRRKHKHKRATMGIGLRPLCPHLTL